MKYKQIPGLMIGLMLALISTVVLSNCNYKYTYLSKKITPDSKIKMGLIAFQTTSEGVRYSPALARRISIQLLPRGYDIVPLNQIDSRSLPAVNLDNLKVREATPEGNLFELDDKALDTLAKIKEKYGIRVLINFNYRPPQVPLDRTWDYDILIVDLDTNQVVAQRVFKGKTDSYVNGFLGIGYGGVVIGPGALVIAVRDMLWPTWHDEILDTEIEGFTNELKAGQTYTPVIGE